MPTPWKITEQWKDNEEEELVDWTQITFTKALNNTGSFSIQFDDTERAVDIMESAWLRIYYDGHCHFHGKIRRKNFGNRNIMIKGADWYGLFNNIEIKYCAADWDDGGNEYPRWNATYSTYHKKEVSVYIKRLIDMYTGDTASDKDVDYDNLDATGWSDSFNHPRTDLGTLMGNLFNSAKVSGSRYGYAVWFEYQDPDLPYLWAKPFGSGRYTKKLYFQGQPSMTWEEGEIINDVTIQGGFAFPEPKWKDLYTENDSTNWTGTDCTLTDAYNPVTTNDKSLHITASGAATSLTFQRTIYPEMANSDGTLTLSHIAFDWNNQVTIPGLFKGEVRILAPDTSNYYYWFGEAHYFGESTGNWFKRFTFGVDTIDPVGSPDPTGTIIMYFGLSSNDPGQGNITGSAYLDNFRLFLTNVTERSKNEASIQKHGHYPRVFQGSTIRQFTYAKELADSFVQLMKDPTLQVRGTLNYFPPDLHLNDAVEIPIYGVVWPLYLSRLSISATPQIIRTLVNAGTIRPTIVQLLKGLNMKEKSLEASADVSGGFDTSLFQSDICFEKKETHCRYACMLAACQNPLQVHSTCTGVTDRDPCINTCQRYSQLKQRCRTCQTISYGGDIV